MTDETVTDTDAGDTVVEEGEDRVYASEVEGRQYRSTSYLPLPYDDLETVDDAGDDEEFPDGDGRFRLTDLPRVPRLRHLVGPSAIMLGASLGSGETLFWPGLIVDSDWRLYWVFWVTVLTQFFINTELQRWTLATGESIFRAFERLHGLVPAALLVGGLVSLGWPGWAATAAQVGATAFGLDGWKPLGIGLMVLIWLSYQLSAILYEFVERAQFVLVVVSLVSAAALVVVVGSIGELSGMPAGAVSFGSLSENRDVAVLLGGIAFAGAGGYLNLSQSLWVREKGYGMGRYQGRLRNPFIHEEDEPIHRDGFGFRPTELNLRRWRAWWRVVQAEHLVTFAVGLLTAATLLMTVASDVAGGSGATGLALWLQVIVPQLGGVGRTLVFVVLFVALFTTEYAIVESFVRNSADVIYELYGREAGWDQSNVFLALLTAFVAWGIAIILLPFQEPFFLLVVGAAMSGVIMWPYTVLTLLLNTTRLPTHLRPGWGRILAMWWSSSFIGYFSILLIGRTLALDFDVAVFAVDAAILGSAPGGYALWVGYLAVQVYAVYRSTRGRLDAPLPMVVRGILP
ncbi:Nramp family divalent metal transporter [Halomicrococcus gelatinilyticus]|uniref:Nramp family divalent metal transporter n=1 Tax=Halomicrococcus gelatinilyticus TaxID=1702103 RepID=UPI002E13449E